MYDTAVIGGGLSGLISSIILARKNHKVLLLEKKTYPFHRVCGEYISNEVKPFLEDMGCFPSQLGPSEVNRFQLTSTRGRSVLVDLDLGGFGVSRYKFDQFLAQKAIQEGVDLKTQISVSRVTFQKGQFKIDTTLGENFNSRTVIGAFGKRSVLDKTLRRRFMSQRSPYVGVKYHINKIMDDNIIALHNFQGGYCGISKIEGNKFNLCYLASREILKKAGNIPDLEENVLCKNPWLRDIFHNSDFLFSQPEVINEISFAQKEPVFEHILMSGDAAGMIAPLCGNGMAMAIHGAKISANITHDFLLKNITRIQMESKYSHDWRRLFAGRLWIGRIIQKLFGSGKGSDFAVALLRNSTVASRFIIRQTHGSPF